MKLLVLDGPDVANSWDDSYSSFPDSSAAVFARGGRASTGRNAGVFAFTNHAGGASPSNSFRPVVISLQP